MLRHDGRSGASFLLFIDSTIHDLDPLQVFLNDFLPDDFNVLFRLATRAFPDSIGRMFLDEYANLLRKISSCCKLGDPLADEPTFLEVALAVTGEQLLTGREFRAWIGSID